MGHLSLRSAQGSRSEPGSGDEGDHLSRWT